MKALIIRLNDVFLIKLFGTDNRLSDVFEVKELFFDPSFINFEKKEEKSEDL